MDEQPGRVRRILCIDGGGFKGAFPASFLATVEEALGLDCLARHFDLIAGTSTGGIVALCLGAGMRARDILGFYEQHGPAIFPSRIPVLSPLWGKLRWVFAAKYGSKALDAALRATLGERRIGESVTRLVIPSMDLERGTVYIYKTSHHERFTMDYKKPMVEAARATSAAPTFFPVYRSSDGLPLIDGGMFANNPAGLAAVEATAVLKWPAQDLRILSLGCTSEVLAVKPGHRIFRGAAFWGTRAADVFMAGQSAAAEGTAQLIAGKENYVRISPKVAPGRFAMDSAKNIEVLAGMGAAEARHALPTVGPMFFSGKAEPFVPKHTL